MAGRCMASGMLACCPLAPIPAQMKWKSSPTCLPIRILYSTQYVCIATTGFALLTVLSAANWLRSRASAYSPLACRKTSVRGQTPNRQNQLTPRHGRCHRCRSPVPPSTPPTTPASTLRAGPHKSPMPQRLTPTSASPAAPRTARSSLRSRFRHAQTHAWIDHGCGVIRVRRRRYRHRRGGLMEVVGLLSAHGQSRRTPSLGLCWTTGLSTRPSSGGGNPALGHIT